MYRKLCMLLAVGALTACRPTVKAPVHDTFTKVGPADAIAPLGYGATSKVVKTRGDYGWFRFDGRAGDEIAIDVKSPNGDAVVFVLDRNDDVVAVNDDADALTSDSHLTASLPGDGTYYIAFREYSFAPASFTVALQGAPATTLPTAADVNAR
ncbi:MAG TPA: PPC domain-containing protein [Polyangia bacterium]|nr:PPC domain-containing protein [Polyangia bacterium]